MYLFPILALVLGAVALAIHVMESFDQHAHDAGLAHQAVDASLRAAEHAPDPRTAAQHVANAVTVQTTIAMPKAAAAQKAAQAQATAPEQMETAEGWREVLRRRALAAATVALTQATNDAIRASVVLVQTPGDEMARASLNTARIEQETARQTIRALGGGGSIDVMTAESSSRIGDMVGEIPANIADGAAAFADQVAALAIRGMP